MAIKKYVLFFMAFCVFMTFVPVAYADEITDEPITVEEVVEETPEDTETETTAEETGDTEIETTTEETGETETETTGEETGETETETTTEETEDTGEETTSSGSSSGETTSSEPTVVYIQVPAEDELPDDLYQSYVLGFLAFFVVVVIFYFGYKFIAMFF